MEAGKLLGRFTRGQRTALRLGVLATTVGLIAGFVQLATDDRPASRLPDYDAIVEYDYAREGGHLRPDLDMWMMGEQVGQRVRSREDLRLPAGNGVVAGSPLKNPSVAIRDLRPDLCVARQRS